MPAEGDLDADEGDRDMRNDNAYNGNLFNVSWEAFLKTRHVPFLWLIFVVICSCRIDRTEGFDQLENFEV